MSIVQNFFSYVAPRNWVSDAHYSDPNSTASSIVCSFFVFLIFFWLSPALEASTSLYDAKVENIQSLLLEKGYDPKYLDGIMGPRTEAALRNFQRDRDLRITGKINTTTVDYLHRPLLRLNTQDFAPYHFITDPVTDRVTGPVPDVLRLVCRHARLDCVLVFYSDWEEAQQKAQHGEAEGLFVIGWNAARAKWLHRSEIIIPAEYGFWVRRDINPFLFENPSDLRNYTVAVYGPSNTSDSLERLAIQLENRIAIRSFRDDRDAFLELSRASGKYAVYSNKDVGESLIRQLGLTDVITYAGTHKKLNYYVGFSKDRVDASVVEQFNKALEHFRQNGDIQEIFAKYGLYYREYNVVQQREQSDSVPTLRSENISRYRIAGQGHLVEDLLTCHVWQRSGSMKEMTWVEARDYVQQLKSKQFAGYNDWRLPSAEELASLLESQIQKRNRLYIDAAFDSMQQTCWSSKVVGSEAHYLDFYEGMEDVKPISELNFVRAVRGDDCAGQ